MQMQNKFIEVYGAIIEECNKLTVDKTTRRFDPEEYLNQILTIAKNQKKIHERNDKYGLGIPYNSSFTGNHVRISEEISVTYFGDAKEDQEKGSGMFITQSDDGRQPNQEHLLCVSFSSGAYFLSQDYPVETFDLMFEELKGMGAKYSDTVNHGLYFTLEQWDELGGQYPVILKKYREMASIDLKEKERERLRERLKLLEENGS